MTSNDDNTGNDVIDLNKNYGPKLAAAMLGACVGSYIDLGVTKEELCSLVASLYDQLVSAGAACGLEIGSNPMSEKNLAIVKSRFIDIVESDCPEVNAIDTEQLATHLFAVVRDIADRY